MNVLGDIRFANKYTLDATRLKVRCRRKRSTSLRETYKVFPRIVILDHDRSDNDSQYR